MEVRIIRAEEAGHIVEACMHAEPCGLPANRKDVRACGRLQPLLRAFRSGMSWLKEDF